MTFSSSCKKTISVSNENQSTPFYLIFDKEKSLKSSNNTELKKPVNYYISVLLTIHFNDHFFIGDFGLSEVSMPGVVDSSLFNIYACFLNSNKKQLFSGVFILRTSKSIQFQLNDNTISDNPSSTVQLECIFSIVPFVAPIFESNFRLLPYLAFSFIHFIPQIKEFNSNWPLISWLRQAQFNKDSSINDLYNIVFPKGEIDLSTIFQGIKMKMKKPFFDQSHDPVSLMRQILYNHSITDADIDSPGITFSELSQIITNITREISLELGLSYKVFSFEPQYSMSVDKNPEIMVFCPTFGVTGTVLTEIMCNNALYTLYSIVKNEEGEITATLYSPYTEHFYDIRDTKITPLPRKYIPLFNRNEFYLMLLYVHHIPHSFFSKSCSPISIFYPKYDYINVIECKLGEKIPQQNHKILTDSAESDSSHIYFGYDENNLPFPSIPLTQVCGKTVLKFPLAQKNKKVSFSRPSMIVWEAIKDDNQNPLSISYVPHIIELYEHFNVFTKYPNYIYAVIQDHTFAVIFHKSLFIGKDLNEISKVFPIQNTVRYNTSKIKYSNSKAAKLATISFTRNTKEDKYLSFVGTPILIEIDFEKDYDALLSDIQKLVSFVTIYIKYQNYWNEITEEKTFLDIIPSLRYVELLVQIQ